MIDCFCPTYAQNNDSFAGRSEIVILNTVLDESSTFYQALCTTCGRLWQIREFEGYHYPIYSWTEQPPTKNALPN